MPASRQRYRSRREVELSDVAEIQWEALSHAPILPTWVLVSSRRNDMSKIKTGLSALSTRTSVPRGDGLSAGHMFQTIMKTM